MRIRYCSMRSTTFLFPAPVHVASQRRFTQGVHQPHDSSYYSHELHRRDGYRRNEAISNPANDSNSIPARQQHPHESSQQYPSSQSGQQQYSYPSKPQQHAHQLEQTQTAPNAMHHTGSMFYTPPPCPSSISNPVLQHQPAAVTHASAGNFVHQEASSMFTPHEQKERHTAWGSPIQQTGWTSNHAEEALHREPQHPQGQYYTNEPHHSLPVYPQQGVTAPPQSVVTHHEGGPCYEVGPRVTEQAYHRQEALNQQQHQQHPMADQQLYYTTGGSRPVYRSNRSSHAIEAEQQYAPPEGMPAQPTSSEKSFTAPAGFVPRAAVTGGRLPNHLSPLFHASMLRHGFKYNFWFSATQLRKRQLQLRSDFIHATVSGSPDARGMTFFGLMSMVELHRAAIHNKVNDGESYIESFLHDHPPPSFDPRTAIVVLRECRWKLMMEAPLLYQCKKVSEHFQYGSCPYWITTDDASAFAPSVGGLHPALLSIPTLLLDPQNNSKAAQRPAVEPVDPVIVKEEGTKTQFYNIEQIQGVVSNFIPKEIPED